MTEISLSPGKGILGGVRPRPGFRRSSFLSAALAGAASLAAPALRLPRISQAQTAALPPGRLALLSNDGLWLLDSDGAGLSPARRAATGAGGWLQDPVWSPDGSRVAFSYVRFPTVTTGLLWPYAEIFAAAPFAAGDPPVLVRRETPTDVFVSPTWAPDGSALHVLRRRPLGADGMSAIVDLLRIDLTWPGRTADGSCAGGCDPDMAPQTGERHPIPLPGEAMELAGGDDGSLAVVVADVGGTGVVTTRLLHLAPPDYAPRELLASDQGLGFIIYPRFASGARQLLFAGGGGDTAAQQNSLLDTLFGRSAAAHGARAWPYVVDVASGMLRRVPSDGLDDLVGLGWLDDRRALVLDVGGLGIVELEGGAVQRVPGVSGTGLAWFPAPAIAPNA